MSATECEMCGHSLAWHQEHQPRHKFNGDPMSLNEKPRVVAESAEPHARPNMTDQLFAQQAARSLIDPVLRMALVNAGVITVEQIDAAQRMSDTLNGVAHEQAHFEASNTDR